MTTIFTRAFIARRVLENLAAGAPRDDALQRVADLVHMTPEAVAEIVAGEVREQDQQGDTARSLAAVSARSIGITLDVLDEPCSGCGACACGKREAIPA